MSSPPPTHHLGRDEETHSNAETHSDARCDHDHDHDHETTPDDNGREEAWRFFEELSTIRPQPSRFVDTPARILEDGDYRPVILYKPTGTQVIRGRRQPVVYSSARTRVRYSTPGSRAALEQPLTREALWLSGDRPPALAAQDPEHECGICHNVKSHPVRCQCGHSFCYVCIRVALEKSWHCPDEFCGLTMRFAPCADADEEAKIGAAEPAFIDHTRVDYSWEGLVFPKRLPGVRYVV
ncbi:hypothetical protein DFH06DRAFT_1315586 [Mycena polygramma]|nr:hypothetical protein DFH06DRAFT_1315586 [Mycena polygramma]